MNATKRAAPARKTPPPAAQRPARKRQLATPAKHAARPAAISVAMSADPAEAARRTRGLLGAPQHALERAVAKHIVVEQGRAGVQTH